MQDCKDTYGKGIVAYRVDKLSPTEFKQTRVDIPGISPAPYGTKYQWNAARQHHVDVQQLPSGTWVAAVDADRVPSGAVAKNWLRASALVLGEWMHLRRNLSTFFLTFQPDSF